METEKQKDYKWEKVSYDSKKRSVNFMRRIDRKVLYSLVGFFGGLIFVSMILPISYEYKTLFGIIGGLIAGLIGYSIATR